MPLDRAARVRRLLVVVALTAFASSAGAQGAEKPYVTRGHQVEAGQKALTDRVARFHSSFAEVLRVAAPDLLPHLEPPRPIATGYQVVPRVYPAALPQRTPKPPQILSYSWGWSETLMANETQALQGLEERLARTPAAAASRSALDSLVTDYRKLIDRKKLVDADVNYNWLWHAEITRVPRIFAKATRLQTAIVSLHELRKAVTDSTKAITRTPAGDSALAALAAEVDRGLDEDVRRVDIPSFVSITNGQGNAWRIRVPILTDIVDTAFIATFKHSVEQYWQARTDRASYAVEVQITAVDPRALYCPDVPTTPPGCVPPAKGASIDLATHIARFPAGPAVLTTGAGSTHVTAARAIVVGPHDATATLFVHEFGHLLGFRDAYLRGSRDAGADGFIITELVVDYVDIMGNSGNGSVTPAHFERLIAVKDLPALVQEGLKDLYQRGNPGAAIDRFREVLNRNPYHFGATLELANALDAADRRAEATEQWKKVLDFADLVGDTGTAQKARGRLGGGR